MKSLEEKKYTLEQWKATLLAIGAISTFLTFFLPYINDREQQMNNAFSEALARLGDDNAALRASAAIDLMQFYGYERFFGFGKPPYQEQVIVVLQNSLKNDGEDVFVRQTILQALTQLDPNALKAAPLQSINLSNLNLCNLNFDHSRFEGADLSGAHAGACKEDDTPVSFEGVFFQRADLKGAEFGEANFKSAIIEFSDLSDSRFLNGADFEKAYLESVDLSDTDFSQARLNGAVFKNITEWNDLTNFSGAECTATIFDTVSEFYQWGKAKFPNCFK